MEGRRRRARAHALVDAAPVIKVLASTMLLPCFFFVVNTFHTCLPEETDAKNALLLQMLGHFAKFQRPLQFVCICLTMVLRFYNSHYVQMFQQGF